MTTFALPPNNGDAVDPEKRHPFLLVQIGRCFLWPLLDKEEFAVDWTNNFVSAQLEIINGQGLLALADPFQGPYTSSSEILSDEFDEIKVCARSTRSKLYLVDSGSTKLLVLISSSTS